MIPTGGVINAVSKSTISRIPNQTGSKPSAITIGAISGAVVRSMDNVSIKKPITINGDGNQTRSFCYVDDLVEGLILMMEPVNIGNPDEITILQLAEEIINLTNSNSKIVFKNLPEDDPVQRQPDIATAKKLLQWSQKSKGMRV